MSDIMDPHDKWGCVAIVCVAIASAAAVWIAYILKGSV